MQDRGRIPTLLDEPVKKQEFLSLQDVYCTIKYATAGLNTNDENELNIKYNHNYITFVTK